ncbi:MAG: DUF6044 family protein, partial [Sporomusaceae bacterium]|nr:DUF6044 family protein [Sporomusaceae bacterium]
MIVLRNFTRQISACNFARLICVVLFFCYLLPFFYLREDAHFPVNDYLDWLTAWIALANSGEAFSLHALVPQFMNGVPRYSLPSAFNVITWLYLAFPPFYAFLINFALVHTAAFGGAYLFFNSLLEREGVKKSSYLAWGAALCFGILPFYTVYGLSIAGQPLLAYAFLNIYYDKKLLRSFFIIVFFAFYSSLPLAGVFIVIVLALLAFFDFWRQKKARPKFLFAIFILAASYCVSDFWLVYNALFPDGIISSRAEIDRIALGQNRGLRGVYALIAENFTEGQYHAVSLHYYILTLAVPLGILAGIFRRDALCRKMLLLLCTACFISCVYGLRYYTHVMQFLAQNDFLNAFQIQRFHWLHPLLWYSIFVFALLLVARIKFAGKFLTVVLLSLQITFLFANNIEYNLYFKEK